MPYKDPEKAREQNRINSLAYYHRNREARLAYTREHKEERQAYNRIYAQAHKEHYRLIGKVWREKNKERIHARNKERQRELKIEVFTAYGGALCVCCNENHIEFLTIDHINGGGSQHRRALKANTGHFYKWLKDNEYPLGFRVLCLNCNASLGWFNYCPHGRLDSSL